MYRNNRILRGTGAAGLLIATFALGVVAPRAIAAAGFTPFQVVNGDGWLTSNATHESGGWTPFNAARPSFGLQLSERNDIPFESGTAGASVWVRQPGCPRFAGFGERCGWQLGLAVTQFRSLVVGGYGIEIDGLALGAPYGRLVNASDGESHLVGLLTNAYTDFSGVDVATDPSWFAGIDLSHDAFTVRRAARLPKVAHELLGIDNQGNARVAGSVATRRALQNASGQWAIRAPLVHGSYTFHYAPYQKPPVCIASSEGGARLRVTPAPASCTITSENSADDATVDVVVVGDPL